MTAFIRSNKGVVTTREGEELLSFARMLLEQADNMKEHFVSSEMEVIYLNIVKVFLAKPHARKTQFILFFRGIY